jgi:PAS domain S-box-containing protein
MTIEELDGDFDCAAYTPDTAAIANVLWGDTDLAIVLVGADRRLLAFNAAAVPSLGDENVRVGGLLTERLRQIWLDDEVDECPPERNPFIRAYVEGEATRRQLVRFNTASYQEQGRMCVSILPVALRDGSRGVFLCWQEIVESQRRDRREIRRLDQLLEGASDYSIVVLDLFGRVQTWSRSAERVHGYSAVLADGLDYAALFPEPERACGTPERILDEAMAAPAGSARTNNLRLRRDGSTFWAEGSVSVLRNEAGDVCGYVEVVHDISDKRAAEQEILLLNAQLQNLNHDLEDRIADRTEQLVRRTADLTSVNAELESFSYSVSHNLRAPLRAIGGYARLVEEECGENMPAEAIRYLGKLTNSAAMLGQLIDGLLELSRTQRSELVIEELDMVALVRECWEALAEDRSGRDIEFTVGDLPPADGDRRLIHQVWVNLLQNAIKYTGTRVPAQIRVLAGLHDDGTRYRVEDNGVGFDMKYAHKIGQVFERLHDGSAFPGTGIGMAIVQLIVLRHGGTVTVHGDLDVGAAMEFSLWNAR